MVSKESEVDRLIDRIEYWSHSVDRLIREASEPENRHSRNADDYAGILYCRETIGRLLNSVDPEGFWQSLERLSAADTRFIAFTEIDEEKFATLMIGSSSLVSDPTWWWWHRYPRYGLIHDELTRS